MGFNVSSWWTDVSRQKFYFTKFCSPIPGHLLDFNYTGFSYQFKLWRSSGRIEWLYSDSLNQTDPRKKWIKRLLYVTFLLTTLTEVHWDIWYFRARVRLNMLIRLVVKNSVATVKLTFFEFYQRQSLSRFLQIIVYQRSIIHFGKNAVSLCSLWLVLSI